MRPGRETIKRALGKRLLIPPSRRFVFVYHDISDVDAPQHAVEYSTTPSAFRAQVTTLAEAFDFVPLDDVVRPDHRPSPGRRLASITFDDGFLSVRQEALPYLSARGIPFSVFLNRTAVEHNFLHYGPQYEHLNRRYEGKVFLDAEDVNRLTPSGVTIGSHTSSHRVLSQLDDGELRDEVSGNKRYLESLIGRPVAHFALPFGKREHYDRRVLDYCCAAGHDYVYSTNPMFFDPRALGGRCSLVPRVDVSRQPAGSAFFTLNRPLLKKVEL